jgi:putative CocE/NonD family hydrolase
MTSPNRSKPRYKPLVERDVPIPMRDGTVLRGDLYRPDAEGRFPVLIERVAYELASRCRENGEYYAQRGYILIGQNVRGAFGSEGAFVPLRDDGCGERQDGYDTVEWAAGQPWSNGRVGMLDGSYSGFTQYAVAPTRPPHLQTLFAREGGTDFYRDTVFRSGAHWLFYRDWTIQTVLSHLQHPTTSPERALALKRLEQASRDLDHWRHHLPLLDFPPLTGVADWYFADLGHPNAGPYWWDRDVTRHLAAVDVPIFHLGGWFDCFLDGTLRAFRGIRTQGATARCRQAQRLVVGPWVHGPANVGQQRVGELDFGPNATWDLMDRRLAWYDYWLNGIDNEALSGPPVQLFLMGANRWVGFDAWPPPGIDYRPFYLRAGTGPSLDSLNNGYLSVEPPTDEEEADRYLYDPMDPVPSLHRGLETGPKDHRPIERRVLTYTSEVLQRALTIIGPVKAVIHGVSSAPDTDWVVRLCDVWPDGRSMSVCDGILRARYRDSLENPTLLTADTVYRFEVDLWATAQVFAAGHRIRVEVTSSDFPRYDRNLNVGGTFGEETDGRVAQNTVFHDAARPSHILLPTLDRVPG